MIAEAVWVVGSWRKIYAKKALKLVENALGLMKRLNLLVKQRIAYKVTTQRKHGDAVADNLLNQNFNP